MDHDSMKARERLNVEGFLRSQWGQALLVFAVVLIVSLAMSVPRFEIAELRGREFSRFEILLVEIVRWGAWGLLAWPISRLASWVLSKTNSWLILLLVQVPISMGCGWGAVHLDFSLREYSVGPGRPADDRWDRRPPPEDRPGRGREAERQDRRPGDRPEDRWRRGQRTGSDGPTLSSIFWRQRWMSAILVYWVVLAMGAGLQSFLGLRDKERRAAALELRAERLRAELARSQLGSLRDQLNPHFLFNALHSVGGLVRAKQEQAALKTLAAIGQLLRSTLDHDGTEEVSLREELNIAERFLEIEHIRLGERLVTEVLVPEEIRSARVPTLLLLPLVENAVKHGIAPLPEGGRVELRAERRGEELLLEVSDNGEGFAADILARGGANPHKDRRSIGLENTRSRLQALYGNRHTLEIDNLEPRGARVRILLPFHEESPSSVREERGSSA